MKLTSVVRPALIVAIVGAACAARAQDAGKVGLTMGYPSSVGVIWNVSDRVAVRPEIGLSRMTGDATGFDVAGPAPISTNDSTGVGVGISGLIYVGRWDALRAYVSPRFSYARNSASAGTSSSTSFSESLSSSYLTSGSFGAQYSLGRRFGLFGEIGLGYTTTTSSSTSTLTTGSVSIVNGIPTTATTTRLVTSSSHANSLATRSGVGVIFYF
jgi:hypothetical protein